MRLNTQDRILSVSFEREPREHAEIMLAAGRRLTQPRRKLPAPALLLGAVVIGAIGGLTMEGYRQLVLEPIFGVGKVVPLGIVLVQILPLIVLFIALSYILGARTVKLRRQSLAERLGPRQYVDVDIFREGLRTSSELVSLAVDWRAVQDIVISKDRIEVVADAFICYMPARAFKSRAEFETALQKCRGVWAEAKEAAIIDSASSRK